MTLCYLVNNSYPLKLTMGDLLKQLALRFYYKSFSFSFFIQCLTVDILGVIKKTLNRSLKDMHIRVDTFVIANTNCFMSYNKMTEANY